MPDREVLSLEPIADVPEVGRWLSTMEDARRDTLKEVEGIPDEALDWEPDRRTNTIGTLLYHVALIEVRLAVRGRARVAGPSEAPNGSVPPSRPGRG